MNNIGACISSICIFLLFAYLRCGILLEIETNPSSNSLKVHKLFHQITHCFNHEQILRDCLASSIFSMSLFSSSSSSSLGLKLKSSPIRFTVLSSWGLRFILVFSPLWRGLLLRSEFVFDGSLLSPGVDCDSSLLSALMISSSLMWPAAITE